MYKVRVRQCELMTTEFVVNYSWEKIGFEMLIPGMVGDQPPKMFIP